MLEGISGAVPSSVPYSEAGWWRMETVRDVLDQWRRPTRRGYFRPMCGRYSSRLPPEYIRGVFRTVGGVPNFALNYNLSPSQDAMVVRRHP
jgi:hypothetical protein